MQTILLYLFILSTTVLSLFSCVDPCKVDFYFTNNSLVEIKVDPLNQANADIDSTIISTPNSSLLFQIGYDDAKYDSVPILVFIDSVKVIFDNKYAVMHYKDSTKGDYSRSIFNMKSYEKNGCEFTYTFTQEDYERAKAVK